MKKRTYPLNGKHTKDNHPATDPQFDFGIFAQDETEEGISIDDILQDAEQLQKAFEDDAKHIGIFEVQTAADCLKDAKQMPIPKMLFGEFWFEGEICILFADTNLGKSSLAVQIGNSITKGEALKGFKLEAAQQKVIYVDFELSKKQFEGRYSENYANHYQFHENFFRAEINPEAAIPESDLDFEAVLFLSLEKILIGKQAKIIIIDNLTYLKHETEKARNALPLMKQLKKLKSKYGLSLLVLAHTPKRDLSKPLTHNDLQGSKMLINFCDSAFAIGKSSQDKSIRYLKQIKCRNVELKYDSSNVCLCEISKQVNFLAFEFLDFGLEKAHLKIPDENEQAELDQKILDLRQLQPDLSMRKIAQELQTNPMRVKRVLERNNM